jgi:hypothetical protein
MNVSTWDAIAEWEPVLRYRAVVTDYLQSDTTLLSGVHVSFLYLESVVASSLAPASVFFRQDQYSLDSYVDDNSFLNSE